MAFSGQKQEVTRLSLSASSQSAGQSLSQPSYFCDHDYTGPVPPVLRRLQAGAKLNLVERKVERDNNTEKQSGLHAPLEFMSICEEDKKGRRMSFWLAE